MERRQRESERQMQALLHETKKLKEENEVLRHQVILLADNLKVSERTPSKTRRHHILGMQSSHMMNKKCNQRKDPHQSAMRR